MQQTVIATLVYLWRRSAGGGREFLMIHRAGRADDFHSGKWNGLGGKLEGFESPWEGASREVFEESGINIAPERLRWGGMLHFPNFKPLKGQDWWCCVLTGELSSGESSSVIEGARHSAEGTLHWITEDRLLSLNLWEGDREFLPGLLSGTPLFGTFRYIDGRLSQFRLQD